MKVSLFTPTNNAKWLRDTHRSLKAQTCDEFEWVVVPNGGASLPPEVVDDPRVVVAPAPSGATPGIGYLKKFACSRCTGDLLVELDHDDLLAPNAVERLIYHAVESGAGFLYSDFVNFLPGGDSLTYDRKFGWETYPVTYDGEAYTAISAFEPCPRSLHHISFAPNHVRAWTRGAYMAVGGHDPALPVCDDHDLVCRTYLKGIKFHHIPEALYLYRERPSGAHAKNTYRTDDKLAGLRQKISNQYTYPLIEEWCRRQGLRMVDLGPRDDCPKGFDSVPIVNMPEIGVSGSLVFPRMYDASGPYHADTEFIAPDSVGYIRAHDTLPFLPQRDISTFWNWAYEILAPGGWLCTATPSTDGRGAWMNPMYRTQWNANSFWYVTHAEHARKVSAIKAKFQAARAWEAHPSAWHKANAIPYTYCDLIALKGQRIPGETLI